MICSDPFVKLARTEAGVFGIPELPLVVIRHPLGGISRDEVKERAAQAVPAVVAALMEKQA